MGLAQTIISRMRAVCAALLVLLASVATALGANPVALSTALEHRGAGPPCDAISCSECDNHLVYLADWCEEPRGGLFSAACKPIVDDKLHNQCVFVSKRIRNYAEQVKLSQDGCDAVKGYGTANKTKTFQERLLICCSLFIQCHLGKEVGPFGLGHAAGCFHG